MVNGVLDQVLAILFVFGVIVCVMLGVVGSLRRLDRYLRLKSELEDKKFAHQLELEEKEDENWRQVPSALSKRIKELEKTCKNNQETIAQQKLELSRKDQFMAQMKVIDLYKKWREEN